MLEMFLGDLEAHWKLISIIGIYTVFLIKVTNTILSRTKDIVTKAQLEEHCDKTRENCMKEVFPTIAIAKKDNVSLHELSVLVKDSRKSLEETIKYRKQILKAVGIISRHSIKLRSSMANTHMILGAMVERIWTEKDSSVRLFVDEILSKEKKENAVYLGDRFKTPEYDNGDFNSIVE
jgi:hypothetical protein